MVGSNADDGAIIIVESLRVERLGARGVADCPRDLGSSVELGPWEIAQRVEEKVVDDGHYSMSDELRRGVCH